MTLYSLEFVMFMVFILHMLQILFFTHDQFNMKLLYIYVFSMPYTDKPYRFMNIQICEFFIILFFIHDLCTHSFRVKISYNPEIYFMIHFLIIMLISLLMPAFTGNEGELFIKQIVWIVKYCMIIYIVSKLYLCIDENNKLEKLIRTFCIAGNINAIATILQSVLYRIGFSVTGIFETMGWARAKGLSHEPATNAFILLTTIAITTFYMENKKLVISKMSLVLQIIAFFLAFSSGAIPILGIYTIIILWLSFCSKRMTAGKMKSFFKICIILMCIFCIIFTTNRGIVDYTLSKIGQYASDIISGTDQSGRTNVDLLHSMDTTAKILFGNGAFSSVENLKDTSNLTNTYIILYCDLGIIGLFSVCFCLLFFSYRMQKYWNVIKHEKYGINCWGYAFISLISIAWLRILFFHQIWFVLALYFIIFKMTKKPSIPYFVIQQQSPNGIKK